jgi:alkanesulfonate monooxygenase SsuD/methylene tetrahydromethanopterin reductase-like flavin-dependent oxidoreductase (luciferase family)
MRYLRDSTDLWKQNFPRFDDIPPDGQAKILEFAFEKYVRTHSLCGSVGQCIERLKSFQDAGVDEIACLIDFGVRDSDVLESLRNIQVISAGLDS